MNNPEGAIREWMDTYPGAKGLKTYWFSLDSPSVRATKTRQLSRELTIDLLSTGDTAADEYRPWRIPTVVQFYASEIIDLTVIGYSPSSPAESNIVLTVPADQTIWSTSQFAWIRSVAGAVDPLIAAWDLAHSEGPDSQESAAVLVQYVIDER